MRPPKIQQKWCETCHAVRVKTKTHRYCSRPCYQQAQMLPRPACKACGTLCATRKVQYCSVECGHRGHRVERPRCQRRGCEARVKTGHGKYCSKVCAWHARKGWELAAKGRVKALAVRRQQYIGRLKAKLKGMTSPAQIWRAAYHAGFNACWQGWLRKIRRGDVVLVKERRRYDIEDVA